MKVYFKNIFTSADNETFSMSKLVAFLAGVAMTYNFIKLDVADLQGYGIAIGAIIAALAAKTATDK